MAVHIHVHDGGPGSGPQKGGGSKTKKIYQPNEPSPFVHENGIKAMSGHSYYEKIRQTQPGWKAKTSEWHKLSSEAKKKWHQVAFEQEKGLFSTMKNYAKKGVK